MSVNKIKPRESSSSNKIYGYSIMMRTEESKKLRKITIAKRMNSPELKMSSEFRNDTMGPIHALKSSRNNKEKKNRLIMSD
jgi:hypothetical protein